jgi:hypothetical protein
MSKPKGSAVSLTNEARQAVARLSISRDAKKDLRDSFVYVARVARIRLARLSFFRVQGLAHGEAGRADRGEPVDALTIIVHKETMAANWPRTS